MSRVSQRDLKRSDILKRLEKGKISTSRNDMVGVTGKTFVPHAIFSGLDSVSESDPVNHPAHYTQIPGVECIQVTRHMNFNRGNAVKYIWRCGDKGKPVEDLRKAIWYLEDEIKRLENKH
jgi:hypothetical protein